MSIEHPALAYSMGPGSVEGGIWIVPELTCDLGDGLVGYYQRTTTDCFRAAVATATQIPYERVAIPDLALAELDLYPFAGEHCLEVQHYGDLSLAPDDVLLVALTPPLPEVDGDFHCAVTRGSEVIFEPWNFHYTDGRRVAPDGPSLPYNHGYSLLPEGTT